MIQVRTCLFIEGQDATATDTELVPRGCMGMGGIFVTPIAEYMATMNEKAMIVGFENHNHVVL